MDLVSIVKENLHISPVFNPNFETLQEIAICVDMYILELRYFIIDELKSVTFEKRERLDQNANFPHLPFFSIKDNVYVIFSCNPFYSRWGVYKIYKQPQIAMTIYNINGEKVYVCK